MQRHVRRCLVGFPRNDLRRLGSHLHGHYLSQQFDTLQSSIETDLSIVFSCMLQQSCNGGGRHLLGMVCKVHAGWSSVELREFRAQQKSCGRELFMTACDSCFFAKRENNLLEHHRWQFLTSDPRFKEYMSLQCQGNHEHLWKRTREGKSGRRLVNGFFFFFMMSVLLRFTIFCRKLTVCCPPLPMSRRLVNDFVHDLRPPQIHMFLTEADRMLSLHLPQFLLHPLHKKPRRIFPPAERERVRKLIHRLHVSGGHVSKTSLRLLLQRRGCPVWMQHKVVSAAV